MTMTISEVAKKYKKSVATVNYWTTNGLKFSWELENGQPKKIIRQSDLDEFLETWELRENTPTRTYISR